MDNGFLSICNEPKLTERNRQTAEKEAGDLFVINVLCALSGETDRQTETERQAERDGEGQREGEGASERASERQTDR